MQADESVEEIKTNKSAVPVVSVSVFSSIRRKTDNSSQCASQLTPSALDLLLAETQQMDIQCENVQSIGELFSHDGRLAAKVISKLFLKEFLNPSASFAVSSLRKKRTESSVLSEPPAQIQTPAEVLADKPKRNRPPPLPLNERPTKKRRKNQLLLLNEEQAKPSDLLSSSLLSSPNREWLGKSEHSTKLKNKKTKSAKIKSECVPESFLNEAKNILPAAVRNDGLAPLQVPKFFGNSGAQSSKPQTHTKKKKWKR